MGQLNERGDRVAEALAHVPERWREAAISWLEREGPERDGQVVALFKDRGLLPIWRKVDRAVEKRNEYNFAFTAPIEERRQENLLRPLRFVPTTPNALREAARRSRRLRFALIAYRAIISDLLDPPSIAVETHGELLERRRVMANNLRHVAHDLKLDPARNVSLVAFLELSGWTPPAGDFPDSDPGVSRGSAVSALRDLANELESGRPIDARDAAISRGKHRSDANAKQRELETSLHFWLRKVTGKPFDSFTVAAVAFALGIETEYAAIRKRRLAHRTQ